MTQQNAFEDIQKLCRDFRRKLRSGQVVRVEDYLNRVNEDSREMLFQNLLHIDIEFQRRQGHETSSEDYLKRFPQHGKLIRQAFFESTLMSADPAAATPAEQRTQLQAIPAGRRLGEYELLRQIGRGAFGAVYKARHLHRNEVVALKLLPLAVDRDADGSAEAERLHKFRREFRALCDVNHPNLVGMQSLEVDGRQWFFTMDLIDGTDFFDYVRPSGKLDVERLRSATLQLAEGLSALHRRSIIHRDVKPANVMVDHSGHVSVLDFGLVIVERSRANFTVLMTKHGFAGTPLYAAPEQMFGDCEPASDWYAVGVMLYEALTGQPPFRGSGSDLMRSKSSTAAPELQPGGDVPPDLAKLVNDLLQRDPEQRPGGPVILERLGTTPGTGSRDSRDSRDSADSTLDGVGSGGELSLIGRDAELDRLRNLHQQLQDHREPLAVFVRGRSGEGKTSLVEAFIRSISTDEHSLVLSGRCYDRESVPFKAIDAVIDSLVLYLRSRSDDQVRMWVPDDIGLLAQLFPMLRRVTAISERAIARQELQDARQLRHRAFAALRDLLTAIGSATPIILFIDDLQWGDRDSGVVLREMLQASTPPAVMLLGTYRSDEAADSAFLEEWTSDHPATDGPPRYTIEVGPLSEEQCLTMLAMRLGTRADVLREQARQLFGDTQGNPYFLDQLLEGADPATGSIEAVPLAELIERRLQRLPPAAAQLLQVIAVAGQAVPLSDVSAIADQAGSAMSVVTHMRNERLARLIGSDDEAIVDTYHDKIRETVLAELPDGERRQLHLTFAEQLISKDGLTAATVADRLSSEENLANLAATDTSHIFDIAHHLSLANDARAFDYHLLAGAVSIAAYSMDTALEHLLIAASLQPREAEQSVQFRVSFLLAKAMAGCKRPDEAIEHYSTALQTAAAPAERAECLFAQSLLYWGRSDYQTAHDLVRKGLAELHEPLPSTAIGCLAAIFWTFIQCHVLPTRISWRLRRMSEQELMALCRFFTISRLTVGQFDITTFVYLTIRSCVIARHSNDLVTQAEAFSAYASVLRLAGVRWLSTRLMRRADRLDQQLPSHLKTGMIDHDRGLYAYCTGRLDDGLKALHLSIERASRCGEYFENFAHHFAWHAYSHQGPTNLVLHHAVEESKIALRSGDRLILAYARYGIAEAVAKRGNPECGLVLAQAAVNSVVPLKPIGLGVAYVQLTRVQIQAGRYYDARTSAWNAIRDILRIHLLEMSTPAFALYAESVIADAWMDNARSIAAKSLRKARLASWISRLCGCLFPTCRPAAWRISGRVAAAAGRRSRANRLFGRAIREAERLGMRYELARTLIDKSVLGGPDVAADRRRGLEFLDEIQCVLPLAEQKMFGLENKLPAGVQLETDLEAIRHALPNEPEKL